MSATQPSQRRFFPGSGWSPACLVPSASPAQPALQRPARLPGLGGTPCSHGAHVSSSMGPREAFLDSRKPIMQRTSDFTVWPNVFFYCEIVFCFLSSRIY